MKLIIEIPEEQYNDIVKYLTNNDGNYAYSDFNLREIIRNGTPYNPSGDAISREALKDIAYINKGNFNTVEGIREWIDNAPTVPQVTVFTETADEKAVADLKAELQNVVEARPQNKWIKIFENPFTNGYVCPFCGHKIQVTEQFLPEVTECESCGAEMKGGAE